MLKIVEWVNNQIVLIDQRKLPTEEVYVTCRTVSDCAFAIKDMIVRGAPAIGVTGAFGLALVAAHSTTNTVEAFKQEFLAAHEQLIKTRPTAVNLAWGLNRMKSVFESGKNKPFEELKKILIQEAIQIHDEDILINKTMGEFGQTLINNGDTVLTHCNAGALATAGFGTALGVIYAAANEGKKIAVFADETRPFLQGARLTAWELHKNNIDVTLITDNMAGWLMKKGLIQKVIVGADRIAANGDTANKIGTYSVAVLAKRHNIPFYVAAPLSTIDPQTPHGDLIPIEERPIEEVTHIKGQRISPEGIKIRNPAFDVTPNDLISAIITEKGILTTPFNESIAKIFS